MKERPILFSAPMVRAILAGTKTQTRRVLRIEMLNNDIPGVRVPGGFVYVDFDGVPGLSWRPRGGGGTEPYPADRISAACPFGVPGDRLWVREAWRFVDFEMLGGSNWNAAVEYRCDGERGPRSSDVNENTRLGWRPSIHMPRWASRITLEVTGVRVERLQEIGLAAAEAEGAHRLPLQDEALGGCWWTMDAAAGPDHHARTAAGAFRKGWDTINGKRAPWSSNPWVWVVKFRRVQP